MSDELKHARVRVPPPLVFLSYLIGALILNWLIPLREPWTTFSRIVGLAAVLAGFALGATAVLRMLRAHTSPDPHRPTTALITDGPYRFTRNPIYLGFLLDFIGFTLLVGTLWGLLLSPLLIVTVTGAVIRAEEIYLEGRFGEGYKDYKASVRPWV